MEEIRDALLRLLRVARRTKKLSEAYVRVENVDNPMLEIYGEVAEAIYEIIGEHTEEFKDSVTCLALEVPIIDDEIRLKLLMYEYRKNHPEQPVLQPKPITITPEAMMDMTKRNGGYMTPEGDWS